MNFDRNPFPWTDQTPDGSIGGVYDANGNQVIQVQHTPIATFRLETENRHRRELTKWVADACTAHENLVTALKLAKAEIEATVFSEGVYFGDDPDVLKTVNAALAAAGEA